VEFRKKENNEYNKSEDRGNHKKKMSKKLGLNQSWIVCVLVVKEQGNNNYNI